MKEELLKIAENLTTNHTAKFISPAKVKEKTIQKALTSYAADCSFEDVIAIMDTTLMGSGKSGFILTEKYLYSDLFLSSLNSKITALSLEGLTEVKPGKKNRLFLLYNNGDLQDIYLSTYAPYIMDLLHAIIELKKSQSITSAEQQAVPEIKSDAFEAEKNSFETERAAFEAEKNSFEIERAAFEAEKNSFETERAAFEAEKNSFETERAAFEAEKQAFQNEKSIFENEKNSFEKENSSASEISVSYEQLEEWYQKGEEAYDREDYETAVAFYEKAFQYGYEPGAFALGSYYEMDEGNLEKAKYWFTILADSNDPSAQLRLGQIYEKEGNAKECISWFQKAAEQDDKMAQYYLSKHYLSGRFVEIDLQQAEYWLNKAESHQTAATQKLFSDLKAAIQEQKDAQETPVVPQYKELLEWQQEREKKRQQEREEFLRKRQQGFEELVDRIYHTENSQEPLNTEDSQKLQEQESLNHEDSQATQEQEPLNHEDSQATREQEPLNHEDSQKPQEPRKQGGTSRQEELFQSGVVCYQRKDYKKAAKLFEEAAQMAHCYQKGLGVQENMKKAFSWLEKSAKQGDADSQFSLAAWYKKGLGCKADQKMAEYWLEKAGLQGHEEALKMMQAIRRNRGIDYYNSGISKIKTIYPEYALPYDDVTDALPEFEKAGELGLVEAQVALASFYLYGDINCIPSHRPGSLDALHQKTDAEKGMYWLEKAVKNNDADSMLFYAKSLFYGTYDFSFTEISEQLSKDQIANPSDHDRTEAYDYAVRSSDMGCSEASIWLCSLAAYKYTGAEEALKRTKYYLKNY